MQIATTSQTILQPGLFRKGQVRSDIHLEQELEMSGLE